MLRLTSANTRHEAAAEPSYKCPPRPDCTFPSAPPPAVAARPPSIQSHHLRLPLVFAMTLVHPPASVDFTSPSPQSFSFPSSGPSSTMPMLHTPPSSSTTCRPPHRQIHRNRASYSCHSCRRRKVKCDRQHPTCGNCSKMAETCVYSDNTGKGAASKEKNKLRERPTPSTPEHRDPQFSGAHSPPKRLRTTSGVSVATIGSEDDSGSSTHGSSHSRSSSLNQADFLALNSPFQEPTTLPHIPHPPLPVASLPSSKEGELETRLAEIVGQLYRYAYTHHTSPPPPGLLTPENPVGQWPPQQLPDHARPQGLVAKTRDHEVVSSSPKSAPVPLERALPQKSPIRTWARPTSLGATHFAPSKDGVADDVALGYLSIQENGRSRYVGTSFWAILSNEVCIWNAPQPCRS